VVDADEGARITAQERRRGRVVGRRRLPDTDTDATEVEPRKRCRRGAGVCGGDSGADADADEWM
jgi:hypothetical protein